MQIFFCDYVQNIVNMVYFCIWAQYDSSYILRKNQLDDAQRPSMKRQRADGRSRKPGMVLQIEVFLLWSRMTSPALLGYFYLDAPIWTMAIANNDTRIYQLLGHVRWLLPELIRNIWRSTTNTQDTPTHHKHRIVPSCVLFPGVYSGTPEEVCCNVWIHNRSTL